MATKRKRLTVEEIQALVSEQIADKDTRAQRRVLSIADNLTAKISRGHFKIVSHDSIIVFLWCWRDFRDYSELSAAMQERGFKSVTYTNVAVNFRRPFLVYL